MLQFDTGVSCRVFHQETAVVLHHASTWAAVAGVTLLVIRLGEVHDGVTQMLASEFAVDLSTTGDRSRLLAQLRGYLQRTLGTEFLVALEADRVHVEWLPPA